MGYWIILILGSLTSFGISVVAEQYDPRWGEIFRMNMVVAAVTIGVCCIYAVLYTFLKCKDEQHQSKYFKGDYAFWSIGLITITLIFISIGYMVFKIGDTGQRRLSDTPSIAVKTQAPYDIGMTPAEFKVKWNNKEKKEIKRNLQIGAWMKKKYEKQDVQAYFFGPTLFIGLTVNQQDGSIRNVLIIGRPTTNEERNSDIFNALLLLTMTVDPQLSHKERQALIIKLVGTSEDRSKLNNQAICGNNMYTANFNKNDGFIFLVSNVLEYKQPVPKKNQVAYKDIRQLWNERKSILV